ncbi:hypothetical protein LCGC14_2500060, partial [marine sediment metagenome]
VALSFVIQAVGFSIEIVVALSTAIVALTGAASTLAGGITFLGLAVGVTTSTLAAFVVGLGVLLGIIALVVIAIVFVAGAIKGFSDAVNVSVEEGSALGRMIKTLQWAFEALFGAIMLVTGTFVIKFFEGLFNIGEDVGRVIGDVANHVANLAETLGNFLSGGEAVNPVMMALTNAFGGLLGMIRGHSPSLADRFWELGDAVKATLNPLQEATRWGKRLSSSVGNMNAEMTLGYGRSTAAAIQAGGGGGGGSTVISVDGAYIQDPNELAEIIAERQMNLTRRNFRRTSY